MRVARRIPQLRWKRLRRAAEFYRPYLARNGRQISAAGACAAGVAIMQLLRPWPLKVIFDGLLMPEAAALPAGWLVELRKLPADVLVGAACGALLLISLLWGLFSYGQAYLTARAGQSVVYDLRSRAYTHLQRLSLNFHQRRQRGDLLMRLTGDINILRDMLVDALLLSVTSALMLLTMVVILAWMDWRLALVVVAVLPFLALTTFRFSRRIRSAAAKQRKNEGRVAAAVGEMLQGIEVIQAFGKEKDQARRFKKTNRGSYKAGLRTTRLEASMARLVEVVLAAGTAGVLWYGVRRVQAGAVTPGDLLVFIAYVQSSFRPLRRLARVSSRMAKAVVCAERVQEILRTEPEIRDLPGAKRARNLRGEIEFRRVGFRYPGGRTALRKVGFHVEPGKVVAIVGPSGAGKSTLLALLLRLYDPAHGKIYIDGRDLRRFRVQSLRDQMAVVLQDPLLLSGTVRDNIAFGKPEASDEEIEHAARLANAWEFIADLPDGMDTTVAETGSNLSGGQRQRIAIARAFLRDAPILLLDEPTFGLDAGAEARVMAALERLMRGRTTLVVAHRLAAVQEADIAVVMSRGRILEMGPHDELLDRDGWYARTWEAQTGGGHEGREAREARLRIATGREG